MTGKMDNRIEDYDWRMAFQCCGAPEDGDSVYNDPNVSAAIGSTAHAAPFQRKDVARVIATSDGENDGASWLGLFELNDGRIAYLEAGCDYTGWDCQSGGHAIVSHSIAHMVQFGLTAEARDRFNLEVAP